MPGTVLSSHQILPCSLVSNVDQISWVTGGVMVLSLWGGELSGSQRMARIGR